MPRFVRLVCLLLVALWLPASLHCQLEYAGTDIDAPAHAAKMPCCAPGTRCSLDDCETVEQGVIKPWNELVRVAAPDLWVDLVFQCLTVLSAPSDSLLESAVSAFFEAPRDWTASWHFVRRTAPFSNAPACLS
jgi:hypothetical protein